MNTKGIKFLAVLAVLAMAFAACAVFAYADESSATGEASSAKWNAAGGAATMGPLDFATTGFVYEKLGFDNEDLGNDIVVSYDVETKTYTVTGTLGYNANADAATDVLKALGMPSTDHYALAFLVVKGEGDFKVKVGTGDLSPVKSANEDCILSMNKIGKATVYIEGGSYAGTYTIDFTSVALSPSKDKNPATPFVGLKAYNSNVAINVKGDYITASGTGNNKVLGNSVTITEVEKSSANLYAEYTISAKLAYNDFKVNNKGMDYHGEELRYALVWQITGLKIFDNYLGVTIPSGMGWNTGDDKDWYHAMASELDNTRETFAFYYKDTTTIAPGTVYLYFGPESMKTQADVGSAEVIKINFEIDIIKKDQIVNNVADAKTALATKSEVQLSVGATDVGLGTDLVIEANKTFILEANGTGKVTGDITFGSGTDAQKITLTGFNGTIEVTKGSAKIYGNPWSAGKITLYKGDVAKISGDIGAVEFDYGSDDGSAKIVVEKDATLNIAVSLTISSKAISMDVEGLVTGLGKICGPAADKVTVTAKDGSEISKIDIEENVKLVAYSGSDVNAIKSIATPADFSGKDANGGTWTYKANVLTLDSYVGTYNLQPIQALIQSIDLVGTNSISYDLENIPDYAAPKKLTAFGGNHQLTKISTDIGTGSLAIAIDISQVPAAELSNGFVILSTAIVFEIDQATVSIAVTGSNPEWTDKALEAMDISAISIQDGVGIVSMYGVTLDIDVMSAYSYESANVFGIDGKESEYFNSLSISSSIVKVKSAGFAIAVENLDIKGSSVEAKGIVGAKNSAAISNESTVTVDGILAVKDLNVKQESTVTTDYAFFTSSEDPEDGTAYNNATITVKEDLIIDKGSLFTNNSVLNVQGSTLVLGNLTNANGTLSNKGTISVPAYVALDDLAAQTITIDVKDVTLASNAVMVKSIVFNTAADLNPNGTVDVTATVTFVKNGGEGDFNVNYKEGALASYNNGKGYVLALIGEDNDSSITVEFDDSKTDPKIGSKYSISVTGSVYETTTSYNIVPNTTGKEIKAAPALDALIQDSGAVLTLTKGGLVNEGNIFTFTPVTIASKMGYAGTLNAAANVIIEGSVLGNITSTAGTVTMNKGAEMMGAIDAKGAVTINGKLLGGVTTDGDVTIGADGVITDGNITTKAKVTVNGQLNGDIEVTLAKGTENVVEVAGTVEGKLTYKSKYVKTSGDTTDTVGTASIDLDGKATYVISLKKGTDATSTTEGVPGYFSFVGNPAVADPTKESIEFTLTEGKFYVDSALIMPEGSAFVVEAGTIFEILKNYSFDVKNAALKISKDAIAHIDTGLDVPVYGKVVYIMEFETADGYYIFSNAAYALSNCDEGSELTVGYTTTINTAVAIKAGVNIIIADDVTVTFGGNIIEMGEGAKITLSDKGVVLFKPTGDNKEGLPETQEYVYYTVSGQFAYGDNVLLLEDVRFTKDSTIFAIPETSTEISMMGVDLTLNEGVAVIDDGFAKGSVELQNDHYYLTRADQTAGKFTLVSGTFGVEEEAAFQAVSLKDEGAVAHYDATSKTLVYDDKPTVVGFDGTIYLVNDTTINGVYLGDGTVIIAEGKVLTLTKTKEVKSGPGADDKQYIGAGFGGYIANGLIPTALYDVTALVAYTDVNITFTSVASTTTTPGYIAIAGKAYYGDIETTFGANLNGFTLMKDASLTATIVHILDNSVADGTLKTLELDVATGKALTYDTTYEDGEYTVYTAFRNIDLDEITDLTIADNKSLSDLGVESKLDLSDKDFTLTVAEGKTLVIDKILIIGTPATSLGDYGSAMVGKFVITDKNYVVAYADVDLLGAEFKGRADGAVPAIAKEAVMSTLDIEDVPYAYIIAVEKDVANNTGIQLSVADKPLVPEIIGYNFTKWNNYDDNNASYVGETNAYAGTKAILLTVVAKYTPGVTYYLNGIQYDFVDMEKKVEYGSTFTAKVTDSKYQGTPLVNGMHSFVVTDSVELQVTGVTPVPEPQPEPEPEPEVDGISLTDILLIVLVVLIAIMVVILILRLNRS